MFYLKEVGTRCHAKQAVNHSINNFFFFFFLTVSLHALKLIPGAKGCFGMQDI